MKQYNLDYLMVHIDALFLLNKPMGEQLKRMVKKEFEDRDQEWVHACKRKDPVFFTKDYSLEEARKAMRIRELRSAEILANMGFEKDAEELR